jgi:hypothetical protein
MQCGKFHISLKDFAIPSHSFSFDGMDKNSLLNANIKALHTCGISTDIVEGPLLNCPVRDRRLSPGREN